MGHRGETKQLKYRYVRTLDLKRWDEFEELFDLEGAYSLDDLPAYRLKMGNAYS